MLRTYQILIADDFAPIREELRTILENSGTFVVSGEAGDGVDLLHLLQRGILPDALILDMMMPKMSGMEALREIRRRGFRFKVLAATMCDDPTVMCSALSAGANGFLLKEGITQDLLPALHAVLEGKIFVSFGMQRTLPDDCNVKALAGLDPASCVKHCLKHATRFSRSGAAQE